MIKLLTTAMLLSTTLLLQQPLAAKPQPINAEQFNGTWKSRLGTFKIWAVDSQKLQVEFLGSYEYKLADGSPMANSGEGSGIALVVGQQVNFKPQPSEAGCLITMKRVNRHLEVQQKGTCGFGLNVSAAGTYRQVNTQKPTFGDL